MITGLLGIQIIYGAFTAGLNAGWGFNTYPKMGNEWLPEAALTYTPVLLNFFNNPVMIQFIHRTLGILLLLAIIHLWYLVEKNAIERWPKVIIRTSVIVTTLQLILGIGTLLFIVPLPLAISHQFIALILLSILMMFNHTIRFSWDNLN